MNKLALKLIAGIFILALIALGFLYPRLLKSNLSEELDHPFCYIPIGHNLDQAIEALQTQAGLKDEASFRWWAKVNRLKLRAGRFKLTPGMNNFSLVKLLGTGKQAPVRITLHSKRLPEDLISQLARELAPDSLAFMKVFSDSSFLQTLEVTPQSVMSLVIPNTYDFFWNTTPQQFLERMHQEQAKFWNESRLEKAKKIGLTPTEVYILASIVAKESNKGDEQDRIAGVYVNRLLEPGWKLEADPTVIYAWKDWTIKRVLDAHCEIDSPYNTYKYAGLPPGPIGMPPISAIDKTLEAEKHDYFFFCAKAGGSGYHTFAKTLEAHHVNARKFHRWLRMQGY